MAALQKTVAWIGLGAMGAPLAGRVASAISGVRVFDLDTGAIDRFHSQHSTAIPCASLEDAVAALAPESQGLADIASAVGVGSVTQVTDAPDYTTSDPIALQFPPGTDVDAAAVEAALAAATGAATGTVLSIVDTPDGPVVVLELVGEEDSLAAAVAALEEGGAGLGELATSLGADSVAPATEFAIDELPLPQAVRS